MLVRSFEPRGKVHVVADDRVFEPPARTERAGKDLAGSDADADLDRFEIALTAPLVEARQLAQHLGRDGQRVVGVGSDSDSRAEHRHDRGTTVYVVSRAHS